MKAIKKRSIKIIILAVMTMTVLGCNNAFAAESTLVEFNYDASGKVSGEKLTEYGDKDGYTSTGENGNLLCYMATDSSRALEWSDPEYNNDGVNIVPIVRASSKNTWGSVPSFAVSVSTKGFTQIKFSAKMAGSSNGPSIWKLQYSVDGTNYTDVAGSQIEIQFDSRENMINYYNGFSLPEAVADKDIVYIRIIAASEKTVIGGNYLGIPWGGETAINNISVRGTDIASIQTTTATPETTTTKPNVQPTTSQKPTENNTTRKNEQTTKPGNERKTTPSETHGNNKNDETTGANGNKNQSGTNGTANNDTSQNGKSDSSHPVATHIVTETNAAGETIASVVYDETQEETTVLGDKDSKKDSKKTTDSKNKKDKNKISTSGEVEKTSSNTDTKSSETIIIVVLVIVLAAGVGAAVVFQKRNKG